MQLHTNDASDLFKIAIRESKRLYGFDNITVQINHWLGI